MGNDAVELTAGPVAERMDVGVLAGRLCEELNDRGELDAAVGGRLDGRTIGVTASVEAEGVEEALHHVLARFAEVCVAAVQEPLPIPRAEVSSHSPPARSSAA